MQNNTLYLFNYCLLILCSFAKNTPHVYIDIECCGWGLEKWSTQKEPHQESAPFVALCTPLTFLYKLTKV